MRAGFPRSREYRDGPDTDWAAGMELRQLRYFVTLAEELHFGRAAEREHIVQSALSQQVQRLERELGVRLLERSTHHVSLTAAGAVLLVEARQILAHVDRAAAVTRNERSAPSRPLALAASSVTAAWDRSALCGLSAIGNYSVASGSAADLVLVVTRPPVGASLPFRPSCRMGSRRLEVISFRRRYALGARCGSPGQSCLGRAGGGQ